MSMDRVDRVDRVEEMKDWARRAPVAEGPVRDGDLAAHLGATRLVAVLFDDLGRAYHISDLNLAGVRLARLEQPRTAINELMDSYGVKDGPDWSAVGD